MTEPGAYGIQIADGSFTDAAGNGNIAYTNNSVWTRLSSDASLAGLLLSAGALEPAFASGTLNYALAVDHDTESLTVTPLASNSGATVTVDGQTVASGSASQPVALAVGANVITILVTAQDGLSTQTYTVTATRAEAVRPDPSQDPEVIGLLNAQANAASRFAQTQMHNFHSRLELLHNEGERRASSMNVRLGMERWSRLVRQLGGLAKVDRVRFYAANCSVISTIAWTSSGVLPPKDECGRR